MELSSSIYELIATGVISVGVYVTGALIISGIKQRRTKEPSADTKMVEFMTNVNTSLESIADSQQQIAANQHTFNTNMALMIQSLRRMPDDIRLAVREALDKDNGHGRRRYDPDS